jgi:predicted permease
VRLVLTESLLVALAGGVLGTGIAYVGTEALVRSVPVAYPAWIVFAVDGGVLSYAFGMSLLTGLVFGLIPALRASRPRLAPSLRDGGRGASAGSRRLRATLVTGELALSLVLLVGAGLMIRSFLGLQATDPGFETRGALAGRVYLSGERFATAAQRVITSRALLERASALPGVERAALISAAPLAGWQTSSGVAIEGLETRAGEERYTEWRPVSSGALGLLRIPIIAGRDITPAEAFDSTSTVVVVNEQLAHRYWPNETGIGKRIAFERGEHPKWLTIVGVSRDIALGSPGERPRHAVWRPWATAAGRTMTVLVRARNADAAALAPALRRAVSSVDPTIAVVSLSTLDDVVRDALWRFKLYGWLFGAFAAAALVLAVVGVYGVIAYQVAQRTRELGVRVALGARPTDVYRLVVGDGARLAGVGLVIGLVLAFGLTRVLRAGLRGVSATDPLVFGVVTVTLAGAALLACWIPARRATRVDPLSALRNDG